MAYDWLVATFVRFVVRLNPSLHATLKSMAEREHRSLHGEILALLEWAVAQKQAG